MTRKAELIKKIRQMGVTGPIVDGDCWGGFDPQTFVMGDTNMIHGTPAFDVYDKLGAHPGGVYYKLKKLLEKCGWTWEEYDPGTFIVCPNW